MKLYRMVAILGLAAMTGIIIYAFSAGDFSAEGSKLLAMPWGVVSMVDLYTGFTLFSGWIIYREKSLWRSTLWVVLMMGLGFWTGSLYVLIALFTCKGDWKRFWLGNRV